MHAVHCDGTRAAALVTHPAGELLLVEPLAPVWAYSLLGMAPPGTHVSHHTPIDTTPLDAAYLFTAQHETIENTSLRFEPGSIRLVVDREAPDACHLPPNPHRSRGHYWRVFAARAVGELGKSPTMRSTRWVNRSELQVLANRTISWTLGDVTDEQFHDTPGLRPVWVWWLHLLQMIEVDPRHALHALAVAGREDQR